jgi:hypothetical protein
MGACVVVMGELSVAGGITRIIADAVAPAHGPSLQLLQPACRRLKRNANMRNPRASSWAAAVFAAAALLAAASTAGAQQKPEKEPNRRPRLALRANPQVGVAPARIVLTAELIGGADDFEDYYCPTVVWEWGDDTESESTLDCEPYQAGKSEIRRRFTVEHTFRRAGTFRVMFRLKRGDKLVASASVNLPIQPGAGERRD